MSDKSNFTHALLEEFCHYLSTKFGYHFSKEAIKEIEKKLTHLTKAFGFEQPVHCMQWLMKSELTKQQITKLASFLTVGETYFFRDGKLFDLLEHFLLPQIIQKKAYQEKTLKIWSAASCTGEEAYSIAILLKKMIPNLSDWKLTIIGTDIDMRYIKKAQEGIYTDWSFRATPPDIKKNYFQSLSGNKFLLKDEIRQMVQFQFLNLAEDSFPDPIVHLCDFDLVLCNNVLIYFTQQQIHKTLSQITQCIKPQGWLIVTPIEVPFVKEKNLSPRKINELTIFQKEYRDHIELEEIIDLPILATQNEENLSILELDINDEEVNVPLETTAAVEEVLIETKKLIETTQKEQLSIEEVFLKSDYEKVVAIMEAKLAPIEKDLNMIRDCSSEVLLLIRAYANQGKHEQAKKWVQKILQVDKLNIEALFYCATIFQEVGDNLQAQVILKKALFLEPNFIMAHFMLGNLLKQDLDENEGEKHIRNAIQQLKLLPSQQEVFCSDGITAGKLLEILTKK